MIGDLSGASALVTGAGSGIGRAAALQFSEAGAAVMAADIDGATARETAEAINARGGRAVSFQADVSDEEAVRALVAATIEGLGGLTCAFNNAGIGQVPSPIVDTPDAQFDRLFAVNVKGAWLCMKQEIAHMRDHGGGSIVNTASALGLKPQPGMAAYGAMRAALVYLTGAAALECAPHGIRVNAVCPGPTRTPQLAAAARGEVDDWYREVGSRVPLGRLGQPADIASAAVWLSSDAASFVTGVALPVDGGERI